MREKKIYCPVNGWDCPYYFDGECALDNPMKDCDDFANMWDEDDDYYADEQRTAWEESVK